jgi:hypothetical protein
MRSLIAFVGYSVVFGMVTGFTDNACHLGGLATGLLLGGLIAKVAPQPQLTSRLAVLAVVAALLAGGGYALGRSRPYHMLREPSSVSSPSGIHAPGCFSGSTFRESGLQSVACKSAISF